VHQPEFSFVIPAQAGIQGLFSVQRIDENKKTKSNVLGFPLARE
jgi:hypothetical protein